MNEPKSALQFVILETTQRCNLRCIHCAVSEENFTRGTQPGAYAWEDLPIDAFYKILPILRDHKPWVHLSGHGETFLHPHFWEMLGATIQAGCKVRFQTNATMLTRERIERIVQLGVELIVVSLDAASNDLFNRIRRRSKLDRILSNLQLLQEAKKRLETDRPALEVEFVAMRQNIHELPDVINLAAKYGARAVGVAELHEYALTVGQTLKGDPVMADWADKAAAEAQKCGIGLVLPPIPGREVSAPAPLPSPVQIDHTNPASYRGLRKSCREPWERMFVRYDGRVNPCCYIYETYGDLTVQNFDEMWNSPKFQALRQALLTDQPPPECVNCPAYGWEPIPDEVIPRPISNL
jgi:MoaA/NifB/PqqE/SkfB family radical SAM enzyme